MSDTSPPHQAPCDSAQRIEWLRAENPSLVFLWRIARDAGAISPLADADALRRLAVQHRVGRAGWRLLASHAPRLIALVDATPQYEQCPLHTMFLCAALLAEARLDEPPPREVIQALFDACWAIDPDPLSIELIHPQMLAAAVGELRARAHLAANDAVLDAAKIERFTHEELLGVACWQLAQGAATFVDRSDRPWTWWRARELAWRLCGATAGDRPSEGPIDPAAEWPVLVPPFERDGIAIEEIWSVAGLRREAVRMANCLGEARHARASMQGKFRAYRLARADNDQRFATVALRREGACFGVSEVRGFANAGAPELAWRIARELAWWATQAVDG